MKRNNYSLFYDANRRYETPSPLKVEPWGTDQTLYKLIALRDKVNKMIARYKAIKALTAKEEDFTKLVG